MPRALARYANRMLLTHFGLVGAVLGSVFLGKYLLNYLVKASTGKLPADLVLAMAGLVFVSSLQYLLPLSLFFALIITLSRLRDSHELTAMIAFGLSPRRVLALFWPSVAGLGVVLALTVFWVMPWAEGMQQRVLLQAGQDPATQWLRPGAFSSLPDGTVVYVGEAEGGGFRSLFLRREGEDGVEVMVAPWMAVHQEEGQVLLSMRDGHWYRGWDGEAPTVYRFGQGRLVTQIQVPQGTAASPRARPLQALIESEGRAERAELHWRLSVVVMALTLAFATQLLAWPQGRQRSAWPLVVLILLYAVYFNALTVSTSWYRKGLVDDPWVIHVFHSIPLLVVGVMHWVRTRRYGTA